MLFLDGMGPRESIACQLQDTVRFGYLDRIKAAQSNYTKTSREGKSFYMVPFGRSAKSYGFVAVESPNKIVFHYMKNGKKTMRNTKNLSEAKWFMIAEFVSED